MLLYFLCLGQDRDDACAPCEIKNNLLIKQYFLHMTTVVEDDHTT